MNAIVHNLNNLAFLYQFLSKFLFRGENRSTTGNNALRKCKAKTNFAACGQNLGAYTAELPYYEPDIPTILNVD